MDYDRVATVVCEADLAVAFTGAGISTASGIPDFRSEGGIWERYDQSDFTVARFHDDPEGFWTDWLSLRDSFGDATPNPAHEALADLERTGHLDAVVTQNVDGLHREAGTDDVVHLHGRGDRVRCDTCGATHAHEIAREAIEDGDVPPSCPDCADGSLEPDSVLFGEALPRDAYRKARSLAERSDVFLVVGTSLTVEPAASLPDIAADWDATLVVVNREQTRIDDTAAFVVREDAATILPRIVDRVHGTDGGDTRGQ